ncbi:MAG: FAD-dependent oxidoreductase [Myxococcaceae bacterium]
MPESGQSAVNFDFIIVGSGFGGSVSALRLSEKGYRVAVVEMGKRWTAEQFPRTNWNSKKFFWAPSLGRYGIQRITLLRDVMILSGAGVGGGSLVYANTLLVPPERVWDDPKWAGLEAWREVMPAFYEQAKRMLGVTRNPRLFRADEVLREVARELGREHTFHATDVAVFFGEPGVTVKDPFFGGEGPDRAGCTFCGGCMVGCRYHAKNTLDRNYLYLAEKKGAVVIPETRVTRIEPVGAPDGSEGYRLFTERSTSWWRKPRGELRAQGVVLAGGVLGTVPLLLRCKRDGALPRLSDELGNYVRTNSEAILSVTARDKQVDLSEGIAITSGAFVDDDTHVEVVHYPKGSDAMGTLATVLTDGGNWLTRPLKWMWNCANHPMDFLRSLWPFGWAKSTVILLVMQTLDNFMRMKLGPFGLTTEQPPGQKRVPAYIKAANDTARAFGVKLAARPQSAMNEVLLNVPTTAHILGGAAMGKDPSSGVIDCGNRVFGYRNLYVVDGSMIGANLGVNPSLTITALAEHAMSQVPPREREP